MTTPKATILVVDDDPRILTMVQRMLDLEGYGVITAATGQQGVDAFLKEKPDLILLDLMLPDISGYDVCKRLREISKVPIIMVTAKSGPGEKSAGFLYGADDYVTKPFSSRELIARIKSVLRRFGKV